MNDQLLCLSIYYVVLFTTHWLLFFLQALFNTFVSTVALYGSATWYITDVLITKLERVHFKLLRSIVPGMTRMSSYEDIILKAAEYGVAICTIECLIRKRMLRFLGHVHRMEDNVIQKQVLHSRLSEGSQCRGAPPMNYRQAVINAIKSFGINPQEWMNIALDRINWYKYIEKTGVCICMKQWFVLRAHICNMKYQAHKKRVQSEYENTDLLNLTISTEIDSDEESVYIECDEEYTFDNNCNSNEEIIIDVVPQLSPVACIEQWYLNKVEQFKAIYIKWELVFNSKYENPNTNNNIEGMQIVPINNTEINSTNIELNKVKRKNKIIKIRSNTIRITKNILVNEKFYPRVFPNLSKRYRIIEQIPKIKRHYSKHRSKSKRSKRVNSNNIDNIVNIFNDNNIPSASNPSIIPMLNPNDSNNNDSVSDYSMNINADITRTDVRNININPINNNNNKDNNNETVVNSNNTINEENESGACDNLCTQYTASENRENNISRKHWLRKKRREAARTCNTSNNVNNSMTDTNSEGIGLAVNADKI